jgi:hypothetical protein
MSTILHMCAFVGNEEMLRERTEVPSLVPLAHVNMRLRT